MSSLSYRLARALSDGRAARGRPGSREEVLVRLLMKRATAHRAGLRDLEAALREQIAWALPVRKGEEDAEGPHSVPATVVTERILGQGKERGESDADAS